MRHKIRAVHFIGIGGVGMCGLAEVMCSMGFEVSGSDSREQPTLQRLRARGIRVDIGHSPTQVDNADCVVYSSAVTTDNVERQAAAARGVPVVPRAQMLGELMRFHHGIAVAGTHGKTTVSSMVAAVLTAAAMSPTCVIGGRLLSLQDDGELMGKGDYVVVEADESDASFLHLQPMIGVVTNVDDDHLEAFGDMNALIDAFKGFLANLPFYGAAILCADDARVDTIAKTLKTPRCITYGLTAAAMVMADNIRATADGMVFDLRLNGMAAAESAAGEMHLRAYGRHNVQNALAAVAVGLELGVEPSHIRRGLLEFSGVARRLETHGDVDLRGKSIRVIDDYAHHPTEITATLAALRLMHPSRRLLLVFQPHRYTRTRRLLPELALALAAADVLVLTDIYAAGETPPDATVAADLFAAVPSHIHKVFCANAELPSCLAALAHDGDLLVSMGAGDIGALPRRLREAGE